VDFSRAVHDNIELAERLNKIKISTINGMQLGGRDYALCERIVIAISHEDILDLANRLIKEFPKNEDKK